MKNAENANIGGMALQREKVRPCFGSQFLLTKPIFWDISVSSRDLFTVSFNKQGKHSSIPLAKCNLFMQVFQNPRSFSPWKSNVHLQGRYLNAIIWDLSKAQHCCNLSWLPVHSSNFFIWTLTWLKFSIVHSATPRSLFQVSPWQVTLLKETRLKNYAEFQTELAHNSSEQLEARINVKQDC